MKKDHLEGGGSQPSAESNDRESIDPGLDDRSQLAKALDIVSRVTAICLVMVLPALGGYYLDQWLGTVILFVILGTVFGLTAGFWQLFQLVRILNSNTS